jgi:hypothetical protein
MSTIYCVAADKNNAKYVAVIIDSDDEMGDGRLSIDDARLPKNVKESAIGLCYSESGELLRTAEDAGHEFHGNQWTSNAGASPHADAKLAAHGYLTNPLQQAGGASPSPAWTGAKDVVEGSLAGQSFGALVASGRPETVSLDSLHSYQTWTRKDSLEHHAAGNYNGWRDKPAAIVYAHEGKDWIIDGNNRLSVLKSEGATHAKVLRIEKSSQRSASEFVQIGDYLFSRLPEEWFSDPD